MPWLLLGLYSWFWLCVLGAGITLPAIHWNSSNPMFKISNNDHIIDVNLYDDIDFICPHHGSRLEYFTVYQVSKREYDQCSKKIFGDSILIVNCSTPHHSKVKRFTILFEPFSAIPNVPEYRAGGTYYFITTSTGTLPGITNTHWGACHFHNMKLTIKVCCDPKTSSSTRSTQPSTHKPTLAPSSRPTRNSISHVVPTGKPNVVSSTTEKDPTYNGFINRTNVVICSASWTWCLLAVIVAFLIKR